MKFATETIAQAIFVINRHSKTALDPQQLYQLKAAALTQLLAEKRAKKLGLQYVKKSRSGYSKSVVLVSCGGFSFHLPAIKTDFKALPHLGEQQQISKKHAFRMSLSRAKFILQNYTAAPPVLLEKAPTYPSNCPYFR